MIANVKPKIQIVDTHERLGNLINIDVAVGAAQFNRTLVKLNIYITWKILHKKLTVKKELIQWNFMI